MQTAFSIWFYSSFAFFAVVAALNLVGVLKTPGHRVPLVIIIGMFPLVGCVSLVLLGYDAWRHPSHKEA